MKITNTGTKIVNIGAVALLPGQTIDASDEYSDNDVIKLLVKKGFLSTGAKKAPAADNASKAAAKKSAEEAAAKKAAEEAAAKKAAEEAAKK